MKKILILIILLLFLFCSCNKTESYYHTGRYEQVLKSLEDKTVLSKSDYLYKIKALIKLGKKNESKESVLLYLLMATDKDEREFATDLFVDLNFSDTLNVLLLRPDDGLKARITLYKSFVLTEDYESALQMLDYLSEDLSFSEFSTLIVNYPASAEYNLTIFNAWYDNITDFDYDVFSSLLLKFSSSEILNENSAKELVNLSERIIKNGLNDNLILSRFYQISGNALVILHDSYNSMLYYKESLKYNPDNQELKKIIGESDDSI